MDVMTSVSFSGVIPERKTLFIFSHSSGILSDLIAQFNVKFEPIIALICNCLTIVKSD